MVDHFCSDHLLHAIGAETKDDISRLEPVRAEGENLGSSDVSLDREDEVLVNNISSKD